MANRGKGTDRNDQIFPNNTDIYIIDSTLLYGEPTLHLSIPTGFVSLGRLSLWTCRPTDMSPLRGKICWHGRLVRQYLQTKAHDIAYPHIVSLPYSHSSHIDMERWWIRYSGARHSSGAACFGGSPGHWLYRTLMKWLVYGAEHSAHGTRVMLAN